MTTAVQIIEQRKDRIISVVPNAIGRDRFVQIAVSLAASPDLRGCDPASVATAIYGCAKLGLVPDPTLGHVYVLPRRVKGKQIAQVQVGYKGYVELARRSRRIADVHAEVVYKNEPFKVVLGTRREIVHEPHYAIGSQPGEPLLAYCTWTDLDSGKTQFKVADQARIKRAMDSSQSAGSSFSPWKSDPLAMWRKTAVIEASKLWPLTSELAQAVQWDEQAERGERQVIDAEIVAGVRDEPARSGLDHALDDTGDGLSDEDKAAILEQEAAEAA